jgi:antitoxin VapB
MDIAKIFENGRSQAVRLPKEYRFDGNEVYIKKVGEVVMLIPKDSVWNAFESGIREFSDDYMTDREQPKSQERDSLK